MKIPEAYIDLGEPLTVSPDEVEEAFVKANPGLSRDGIAVTCGSPRLSEVRICLSQGLCNSATAPRSTARLPARQAGHAAGARRQCHAHALERGLPKRSTRVLGSDRRVSSVGNRQSLVDADEFASMNCAHELSPRLSRRQFRRRRQARRAVRILVHLREKPAAFRVIDTHAGAGRYDLAGPEAARTRRMARRHRAAAAAPSWRRRSRALLAPYLDAVAALNPARRPHRLSRLAGARAGAAAPAGPADRLRARAERRGARSARNLRGDARAKAIAIDGWTALNAYVPPKERRGLVLIDPPFEQPDEFARLAQGLAAAHRKWPTGIYLLWYPIKDAREAGRASRAACARLGIAQDVARRTDACAGRAPTTACAAAG